MKKIDVFNHILPDPFHKLMMEVAPEHKDMGKRIRAIPATPDKILAAINVARDSSRGKAT